MRLPFRRRLKPSYPWTDWFREGTSTVLRRGIEFECTTVGMLQNIYKAAMRRGLKDQGLRVRVSVSRDDAEITLTVYRVQI